MPLLMYQWPIDDHYWLMFAMYFLYNFFILCIAPYICWNVYTLRLLKKKPKKHFNLSTLTSEWWVQCLTVFACTQTKFIYIYKMTWVCLYIYSNNLTISLCGLILFRQIELFFSVDCIFFFMKIFLQLFM